MLKTLTFAEQVAVHLREELKRGRWTESMPGRDRLASELGVNSVTVERALKMLEREGVLKSQGVGRRRAHQPFGKSGATLDAGVDYFL
jgi:DNA-binding GntR family transcriptional regulator